MHQTLTKDVIGYDAILLTFLVKVFERSLGGLKENSTSQKFFQKMKIKL
jgi:hypothetical protein